MNVAHMRERLVEVGLNTFREYIKKRGAIGVFSKTTDSSFVEAAGLAGLDFIILDMEHGPANWERVHDHVRAARLTSMHPIVRVSGSDPHAIGSALDSGAAGIQVPNINNAHQAREVVRAARFSPQGDRGVCRFVRAAGYGAKDRVSYFNDSNEAIVVLQVEGMEGVRNLDSILGVEGFDVLFVGPYDLSQSIGRIGEVDSPEVVALIEEISVKAKARGVVLGTFCDGVDVAQGFRANGFGYLAYSVDVDIFRRGCRGIMEMLNE
ncbi:HpcH/HpaI aldolase/citrate lyase family protein [Thioalkalivibrio sp. ALE28]|uniref:HpcH/HpaI aldolase family protein n=1 Tax=Thioalkalivibrio sp. ALE28 TaxID=1158179 RepID=UPI0018C98352|nr:aldolase/citrate lyase family protein [Thioalkalivibrio sp. ALE28]